MPICTSVGHQKRKLVLLGCSRRGSWLVVNDALCSWLNAALTTTQAVRLVPRAAVGQHDESHSWQGRRSKALNNKKNMRFRHAAVSRSSPTSGAWCFGASHVHVCGIVHGHGMHSHRLHGYTRARRATPLSPLIVHGARTRRAHTHGHAPRARAQHVTRAEGRTTFGAYG